jgi:ethanolamine utilization microcompartment shell protein EutS
MPAEKRYLVITPNQLAFSILNPDRDVTVHLDLDPERTGLLVDVVIRMTPTEARRIAETLVRKADAAEAGLPRA